MSAETGLFLSERIIPLPSSVSAEARAALCRPRVPKEQEPPREDKAAWRAFVDRANATWAPVYQAQAERVGGTCETVRMAGVTVYVIDPAGQPEANRDRAVLFVHGGGLVLMGGDCCRYSGAIEAARVGCRVYAVDYGNPPDHPYPHGVDDCVKVYRALLDSYPAAHIAVTGSSGGGNIAASAVLKIRDQGLPMPGALGLFTPELDLTQSGDSFETLRDIDNVLQSRDVGLTPLIEIYAGDHDLSEPYLSPIFADFTKGYPPTFLQSGTRDLFLSNVVRMHRALRKANVPADLHVGEAQPHGPFGGAPEDDEMAEEFRKFLHDRAGFAAP